MLVPDLNVNVFRINRTFKKDPLVQFLCFFLSQKKRLQDTCEKVFSSVWYQQFNGAVLPAPASVMVIFTLLVLNSWIKKPFAEIAAS